MNDFDNNDFQIVSETIINTIKGFANIFQKMHYWLNENYSSIFSALSIISDVGALFSAAKVLADNQIVFIDNLSIELAKTICETADVKNVVLQYYLQNDAQHMDNLIKRCLNAKQIINYRQFYSQIIDSYNRTHYQIACVGLFSIVDGILSDVESTMNNTSFEKRLKSIENKVVEKIELDEFDIKLICIVESIDKFNSSIFAFSDFSQKEPDNLNRNWLLHGRTRREYSQYDFLKILLWLDALIFLDNTNTDHEKLKSLNTTVKSC